ncbi:uncharacterized protein EI90DRAFT_3130013 [Cantharellus anzutake]|uniref:uncharacterized protein n=1 Tax=Cantharellus anzutake TaxID=1750568 RepID=UPI0019051355|nr:uncharacterized protein EI90DRAFT_3130013 [Cantharellus anzutake]KAF8324314.1 hypothetical protein EI90DRAFT_3130013 [Cantharellus anzutake]
MDDIEYRGTAPSSIHTTPSQRQAEPPSENTKKRVQAADPNDGRCLIENRHPDHAIQYAHCLPRALSNHHNFMTSLEWHWNLQYHTLNLNTRYNIFRLGATLHALFDNHFWILVPEERVVDMYHSTLTNITVSPTAHRNNFPLFNGNEPFKYKLFPIPGKMDSMAVCVQHVVRSPPQVEDFTIHLHPFQNIPFLLSHIRPHFVIARAGRTLRKVDTRLSMTLSAEHPLLVKVVTLYDAWTRGLPTDVLDDESFNPPPPEGDEDNDEDDASSEDRTAPHRDKKRKLHRGSPTRGSSRATQQELSLVQQGTLRAHQEFWQAMLVTRSNP